MHTASRRHDGTRHWEKSQLFHQQTRRSHKSFTRHQDTFNTCRTLADRLGIWVLSTSIDSKHRIIFSFTRTLALFKCSNHPCGQVCVTGYVFQHIWRKHLDSTPMTSSLREPSVFLPKIWHSVPISHVTKHDVAETARSTELWSFVLRAERLSLITMVKRRYVLTVWRHA